MISWAMRQIARWTSSASMTRVRATKTPPYGGVIRRSRSANWHPPVRAGLTGPASRSGVAGYQRRRRTLDRSGHLPEVVGGVEPAGPHRGRRRAATRSEARVAGPDAGDQPAPGQRVSGPVDDRTDRRGGDPAPRCAGSTHQPSSHHVGHGAAGTAPARPPRRPHRLGSASRGRAPCRPAGGPPIRAIQRLGPLGAGVGGHAAPRRDVGVGPRRRPAPARRRAATVAGRPPESRRAPDRARHGQAPKSRTRLPSQGRTSAAIAREHAVHEACRSRRWSSAWPARRPR